MASDLVPDKNPQLLVPAGLMVGVYGVGHY